MENFCLKKILPAGDTDLRKSVFIILLNATSIPPHLLLSVDGEIYSITDSGRQLGSPLEKLVLFIKRKNVPSIFVEWKQVDKLSADKLKSETRKHFMEYDRVVEGKISCLFPLRDVVADILGDEMKKADFIFELLPLMEKQNALGNIFSLNMEKEIMDGSFELLTYTNDQLREALQSAL